MDKKDAAFTLFEQGFTQKDMAKIFGVGEDTIGVWKKAGDWDSRIAGLNELYRLNSERVAKLISYQLRALEKTVARWEQDSDEQPKLIGKGEIDALSKLYATIKTKDMEWSTYIRVMREFIQFISTKDLALSKRLTETVNDFLNQKQTTL